MIRIWDKQSSLLCLRGDWEQLQKGWEIVLKKQDLKCF